VEGLAWIRQLADQKININKNSTALVTFLTPIGSAATECSVF
jgi:hypothetical protein